MKHSFKNFKCEFTISNYIGTTSLSNKIELKYIGKTRPNNKIKSKYIGTTRTNNKIESK